MSGGALCEGGEEITVTLSGIDLSELTRWDRLAEFLASDLVIGAHLAAPPEERPTFLEAFLESDAPLALRRLRQSSDRQKLDRGQREHRLRAAVEQWGSIVASITNPAPADWGAGYCVELVVTNTSSVPVTDWSVSVNMNQTTLGSDTWNGLFMGSSGVISIEPGFDWNQTILPGATETSVGFCGNRPFGGGDLAVRGGCVSELKGTW